MRTERLRRLYVVVAAAGLTLLLTAVTLAQTGVMFVTGNKVGIGIDTPTEQLHLFGSGSELKMRLELVDGSNGWAYSVVSTGPVGREKAFRISKQGTGGPELDIIGRNDPGGEPTLDVSGSIRATNVVFSSSRELKTAIAPLDGKAILDRLAGLQMSEWRLKTEHASARHVGPMAEDFHSAFELGDGKTISVVDANGIALASIQALFVEVQERDERIDELASQVETLKELVYSMSSGQVMQ